MRQTLFRIWFEHPWAFWTNVPDAPPYLGAAWVWLGVATCVILWAVFRKDQGLLSDPVTWVIWGGGLLLIGLFGPRLPVNYLPVFGYGAMVLCGFLGGTDVLPSIERGKLVLTRRFLSICRSGCSSPA